MKTISDNKLILGAAVLFALIAFFYAWANFFMTSRREPEQLPALPEKATAVIGVNLPDWYEADPVVRSQAGAIYTYTHSREAGEKRWLLNVANEEMSDTDCQPKDLEQIRLTAGEIVDCRQGNTYGEWCPAPRILFAVTKNGLVWRYQKDQPCTWLIHTLSLIAGFVGFALSAVFVAGRRIRDRFFTRSPGNKFVRSPGPFLRLRVFFRLALG